MIETYARVAAMDRGENRTDGFAVYLRERAGDLADHAEARANFPGDKRDIRRAYEGGFSAAAG